MDEQNQQTAMFSEDRQAPAADARNAVTTDATLYDIEESDVEHCSPRLFKPVQSSANLDTADVDRSNVNSQLDGLRDIKQPMDCTQTSAAAAASLSLPLKRG